jgi:tRNA A-37 threonylcarbamoyl transferase component Bud32/predicted negative regulator of RcsB-dependent stress response
MCQHKRAILAACICGLWFFSASVASSASTESMVDAVRTWGREITESDAFVAVEAPLLGAYENLLRRSDTARRFDAFATTLNGQAALAGLAFLFSLLAITARRFRALGELTVALRFPHENDGEFEVQLFRQSPRRGRSGGSRSSASHTRSGVRRETQFDGILPGVWFLQIEGQLRAPKSGASLASICEEVEITIAAKQCRSIERTLPTVEVPIEFRIHWDRQPAREVGLSVRGRPESVRYAAQGRSRSTLPLGEHVMLIGAGDRVVEAPISILDYEPKVVQIDLATADGLVFKGCPPAVAPFLQGDLGHAARALERDGQAAVASLLLARLHQDQGQTERAAEQLENAGRKMEAAELRRSISDFDRAALLFEDAGDLRHAAEMYDAAESWSEAARAYAALEAWSDAARCFEQAGDQDSLIGALEGQGELFKAAALASELDDRARSIRLLQQVGPNHSEYGRAAELLALAFEQEGHLDLAANQLERRIESLAPEENAPQLELHLSELLEETGDFARALSVLETLRDREPTYPDVAARIESLRKKISGPAQGNIAAAGLSPPAGATAFVVEDRYEIIEEVGRGGMGLVYKARDRRLGRIVALKRMPENLRDHPAAVSLFLGEAQAAARMNHPNIVTLYDADQENGHFFITMELLEGLPLNAILKQRGRFGPRDSARLGIQICAGLQFAHDQGIVHRDIKTANLFITRERNLKIMDFGLAKILEAVRDKGATLIAGTPFYMAPEQAAGNVTDGRTDLYALGVTLFELSTGQLPFSEGDVAGHHRETPPPDAATIIKGYPSSLAALIQHLMAKTPEERPASAAAVSEMLTRILNEQSS